MQQCFIVFVLVLPVIISIDPCTTPNGHQGDCIVLGNCQPLNSFFEDHLTTRQVTILRKSHCGFKNGQPKVCCPTESFDNSSSVGAGASSNLLPDGDSCGRHYGQKIVGGEKTAIDEFPWMALLEFKFDNVTSSYECGGSLINNRYVLTAAHCISSYLVGVRLGEYNTQTNPDCVKSSFGEDCAPEVQDFGIEETIVYHGYDTNNPNFYHDIALIRLDREVKFTDFIQPVCLPLSAEEDTKSYVGNKLTVCGWGLTEKELSSTIKLKVQVPVKNLTTCMSGYKNRNVNLKLEDGQICAGGSKGKDSCRGDSGGPLMTHKKVKSKDVQFYVIGVVSFGPNPCGQDNLPAVYTKVAKYTKWITEKLKP